MNMENKDRSFTILNNWVKLYRSMTRKNTAMENNNTVTPEWIEQKIKSVLDCFEFKEDDSSAMQHRKREASIKLRIIFYESWERMQPQPLQGIEEKSEYQKCPKCDGQGQVAKPSYANGDFYGRTSSSLTFVCDVCNGAKIIARPTQATASLQSQVDELKKENLEKQAKLAAYAGDQFSHFTEWFETKKLLCDITGLGLLSHSLEAHRKQWEENESRIQSQLAEKDKEIEQLKQQLNNR